MPAVEAVLGALEVARLGDSRAAGVDDLELLLAEVVLRADEPRLVRPDDDAGAVPDLDAHHLVAEHALVDQSGEPPLSRGVAVDHGLGELRLHERGGQGDRALAGVLDGLALGRAAGDGPDAGRHEQEGDDPGGDEAGHRLAHHRLRGIRRWCARGRGRSLEHGVHLVDLRIPLRTRGRSEPRGGRARRSG